MRLVANRGEPQLFALVVSDYNMQCRLKPGVALVRLAPAGAYIKIKEIFA
jgi:hypothetical protein